MSAKRALTLAFFALAAAGDSSSSHLSDGLSSDHPVEFQAALDIDDLCLAGPNDGSADCGLELRQLRGLAKQGALRNQEEVAENEGQGLQPEAQEEVGDLPQSDAKLSANLSAPAGFSLVLSEDFNAPIDLDSHPIWTWSDGGLSEGQVRFAKEHIQFRNGKMRLVAAPNPSVRTRSCSHAEKGTVGPKPLVSGELRTRHNMFRYGRYEVRMKAPTVQQGDPKVNGNFVCTMFVYRDGKFKHWREIDFEITGDSPNAVTTNMLNADGTSTWSPGIQRSVNHHVQGLNTRSDFHVYAFEWLPDRVTWYVDGVKVREQHKGQGVAIPDKPGKIMMNLWIFGPSAGFGGTQIQNNQYPMVAEYDYFRFYKWNGDAEYPCGGLGTSCLTEDDHYLSGNNPCDGIAQLGQLPGGKTVCQASC